MIESIFLTTTKIGAYRQSQYLTAATGFFYRQNQQLFLVTSRHVMIDEGTAHHPDRLDIELHNNRENLAESVFFSIPLFRNNKPLWRQGQDSGGPIDIAIIEIDQASLPKDAIYFAFTSENLPKKTDTILAGSALLVVGFPLGFHDNLHHLPVLRQAILASSFRFRFQGQGFFLTDARTHRGISGSPVVMRDNNLNADESGLPWKLLGVHSARLDVGTRDINADEALGLNCAWYADILTTLAKE